jgi:hypothetical protein
VVEVRLDEGHEKVDDDGDVWLGSISGGKDKQSLLLLVLVLREGRRFDVGFLASVHRTLYFDWL